MEGVPTEIMAFTLTKTPDQYTSWDDSKSCINSVQDPSNGMAIPGDQITQTIHLHARLPVSRAGSGLRSRMSPSEKEIDQTKNFQKNYQRAIPGSLTQQNQGKSPCHGIHKRNRKMDLEHTPRQTQSHLALS